MSTEKTDLPLPRWLWIVGFIAFVAGWMWLHDNRGDNRTWRVPMALTGAGLIVLRGFLAGVWRRRASILVVVWSLIIIGAMVGRPIERLVKKGAVSDWSFFHYYLGAKYFTELGYDGLYEQAILADHQNKQHWKKLQYIRNLYTYAFEPPAAETRVRREAWTDARWQEFTDDVEHFYPELRRRWEEVLTDRGYNATPPWNTSGWILSHLPATKWGLAIYGSVDAVLLLLAFGFFVWTFGPVWGLLAAAWCLMFYGNQGPVIGGHRPKPYQELHLYSELMAATEPMNENAYLDYWRYRDNHPYDYELPDEPIVKTAMAGFWRMYDQATIAHCRESSEWKQEFKNFYALFAGWTDDNTPEHLTAFSAGSTPSGYSSDKYNNHPDTVNSFGTVMGFGLHGDTVPVVGAYFAYRDGRRQDMEGSASYAGASMLTRISYEQPSWLLASISPTDHQYGSYALGELLSPGSIDRTIANPTYLEPQWSVQTNGDYLVEFSQLVKRQVWGTADGSNWDFLGFQLTPYSVPSSLGYTNFAVVGAEGELLVPDTTTSTNHEYDVTDDFDSTLYIVRAVSTNTTNLRVQWFNGASFISEQTNSTLRVDAVKPTGATTMKVDLYGNDFDQISVELDGKPELFSNHGFEDGNFNGWSSTQQAGLSRVNVADTRLEGSRACEFVATVGAVNGNYTQVYHEYDISGDPTNTHYVLEYDVLSENLEGSSLSTRVKFYDGGSSQIRDDYFDSYENAHSQTRLSAGIRKRDNDHETLRFIIRLTRNDASAVTADEHVLVDNLRLLKMQP